VIRYFDKDGTPLPNTLEWGEKFEDPEYKRVAETTLPDGTWVSTVWLGLDHQYGDGPPLIFETMVFPFYNQREGLKRMEDRDMERYSTLQEAEEGHRRMVDKWMNAGRQSPEDESN